MPKNKESNYAVRVWFSEPEKIDAFKAEAGAFYELPSNEIKILTLWASNDKQAKKGIEETLAKKMSRNNFEIVDVRRLN